MSATERGHSALPAPGERRAFDRAIAAHARPALRSSVRVRLLVPVLLATAAVATLGAIQIGSALDLASRADRSTTLANASGSIGALVHEISAEYVASNQARRPGGASTLDAQLARTDAARSAYEAIAPQVRAAVPQLAKLSDGVDRALAGLAPARAVAADSPDGSAEVTAYYDQVLTALLAMSDALAPQMDDQTLIELGNSVTLAAGLDRLAALQMDLVSRGLARGTVQASEQIVLAQWVGAERSQEEALTNLRIGGESYTSVRRSAASTTAASIRQVLLDDRIGNAASGVDPAAWAGAQTGRMRELWTMEQRLAQQLDREAIALGTAARERAFLFAGVSLGVVAVALSAAVVMAVRIGRRLRRTRYAALTAARIELPMAISNVIAARDAETVRGALTGSSARIESMLHGGQDEIGELATAFGAVHRQALRLAADQALLRMEVQAMFVALSRRGQTLVQRQIHLLDEFSRNETDPDALARLFALDHLAARMRRNEENLLVLAGGEPGRWITRPAAIVDLVRAAAQEIEEYRRVEVLEVPDGAVGPHVAGDVIHLLAELLENATSFSPPSSMVNVSAVHTTEGLVMTLRDSGIGMPADRLSEANSRLAHPSALTSTLVGTMGLLVVARLAQRHGISVRLDSVAARGTTATVTLPGALLAQLTPDDRIHSGQLVREPRELVAPASAAVPTPAVTVLPRNQVPRPRVTAVADAAGVTRAGLPRRPPDGRPTLADLPPSPPTTPDPEAIRARLASLASGIAAAAANQNNPHPPNAEDTRTST